MTATWRTRLAAVWLVGVGVLLLGLTAFLFVSSVEDCGESGYQFACDVSRYFGVGSAIVGALHLAAAAGVWLGRLWGAAIGTIIAAVGLLVCIGLREFWSSWFVLPVAAGYLGTLLALAYALITRWRERGR